jgi:hypothetical protein
MIILDLVVTDEFNEPFHYASRPLKIDSKPLFENNLNLDLGRGSYGFGGGDRFEDEEQKGNNDVHTLSVEYICTDP